MLLKIRIGNDAFSKDVPWDELVELKEILKKLGFRWNPDAKEWVRETPPPCGEALGTLSTRLLVKLPCTHEVRIFRNYAYVPPELVKDYSMLQYTVTRYRKVTCEEYCTEKAYGDVDLCIDRCEEGDWSTVLKVEEVVQLWRRADDGKVMVPRGLVPKLNLPPNTVVKFTNEQFSADGFEGLRDYQRQVGVNLLKAAEAVGGGIAVMATGGGKSYMAGWLAKQLIRQGYNVIVTSLSIDLTNQLREFAARWGAQVHAYTIQTLYRRLLREGNHNGVELDDEDKEVLQYMDEQELSKQELDALHSLFFNRRTALIIDEVHHVPARTVKKVAMNVGDGWGLRFGLTATPYRNDGRELEIEAWVGPVVEPRINSSFLIQHGYAVPVTINMIRTGNWGCRAKEDANPTRAYASVRKCLAESKDRNEFIVNLVAQAPKPVMVLTSLVRHAQLLYRVVNSQLSSLRVDIVTGVVKGSEREEIFNALRNGQVDVLAATTLADEGLDLPPLKSLILTLGGKSKTRTLQRIGRLVRPHPGKTEAIAYDIWDSANFFIEQGEERKRLYETEPNWKIKVREINYEG